MECQCLVPGLWIEMSGTFDGVGVRVRKPRDKLLDSFRVLSILVGNWKVPKEFHPR